MSALGSGRDVMSVLVWGFMLTEEGILSTREARLDLRRTRAKMRGKGQEVEAALAMGLEAKSCHHRKKCMMHEIKRGCDDGRWLDRQEPFYYQY